ncbi:hypothetical protein CLV51_10814 [Chitinophaga niastensis]|uniref:Uncharacterized protein n=1 Tax=Chitinophaga niastensis TaxID=536980 RepID=A0A2P8HAS0_CHINA|nr:hypothetical protein [Chitinophaga niastensis]PSL43325.1 hypothetical protein CLV51_10814 [Chitinophaga niastensis]
MSDSTKRPIPSDAGAFISLEEMNTLTRNHDDDHAIASANQKSLTGHHIKAMCFGKDKVLELLDHPDATALRIYYGLKVDTDGSGVKEKKMVLVAVDSDGNDILPTPEVPATATGAVAKSMSTAKILDAGLPCPDYCGGTKPPKPAQP